MNRTPVTTAEPGFRPEIEGLRGLAVLLVVLFHAGVVLVPGGFVGVDVFFVISGFLITGLLVRERERTGRVSFAAFYARRVRRLLPAAAVVLVVTLVGSMALVSPLDRPSVVLDGGAAALSVGNVRFALAAGDYFAAVGTPSPFLHFWSLAVEEQFYLVWPALLLVAAGSRRGGRLAIGLALVGVLVASLGASVVLTDSAPNLAFYLLPTRAWQLALGGLLAVAAGAIRRVPWPLLALVGWAGMAGIALAAVSLDASGAYPGTAALLPTLGSAAVIAAAGARLGPIAVLALAPVRFVGRISYSLYLWHWPILVLVPLAVGGDVGLPGRLALAAASVVVATASWALVEEPFRRGLPVLRSRPRATVAIGLATIALLVGVSGALASVAASDPALVADTRGAPAPSLAWDDASPPATAAVGASEEPSARPSSTAAATPGPHRSPGPTSSPVVVTSGSTPAPPGDNALPADVRPSLADARTDEERLRADHCLAFEPTTVPNDCVYGARDASFTIALVGDSHAAHWFPALEAIAQHRGWRLLVFTKVSCPFIDMRVTSRVLEREYRECATFRAETTARLRAARPELTLVAMSRWIKPLNPDEGTVPLEGAAIGRALAALPGRVAIVVDTPYGHSDVPSCLSAHLADIRPCTVWMGAGNGRLERTAAAASGAAVIDLTSALCTNGRCPAVSNGMIVFRDSHHLTATFSRSLAPVLDRAIRRVIGG